jgi:hypothetical protein
MKKIINLCFLLLATPLIAADGYLIKIKMNEKTYLEKSYYDDYGFTEKGINRDTGTKYDLDGYDKEGFNEQGLGRPECLGYSAEAPVTMYFKRNSFSIMGTHQNRRAILNGVTLGQYNRATDGTEAGGFKRFTGSTMYNAHVNSGEVLVSNTESGFDGYLYYSGETVYSGNPHSSYYEYRGHLCRYKSKNYPN